METKHEMPVLTDEQREIHIDHCQKSLAAIDNNLEKFRKLDDAGTVITMLERERVVYATALAALEIALPVLEHQGGWISCSERMPPSKTGVLVGCQYGYEWATKWATLIHGHPDASNEGWLIPGASWVPTHWHELPAPPQPQPTNPQIENDGWLEWKGGDCPIGDHDDVEVKFRDGVIEDGLACHFDWSLPNGMDEDGDIIAYRVIEQQERERGEEE